MRNLFPLLTGERFSLKAREWNVTTHNAIHAWPGSLEDMYQSGENYGNIQFVDIPLNKERS